MKGVKAHVRLIAAALLVVGAVTTLWQIFALNIPVSAETTEPVWVIDTKISFQARSNSPVKVQMYLPPSWSKFITLDESFVARNYGVNVDQMEHNRRAVWSARRAEGSQQMFYRLMLTQRSNARFSGEEPGPQFSESPKLEGAEKVAVEALLKPIREHSADIETFIREAIKLLNDTDNDNARLLLRNDYSERSRTRVLELLLASAHIPVEQVHTLRLISGSSQTPELWVRSYNGQRWLYFNPATGEEGLPEDRIVWWTGSDPIAKVEGGYRLDVEISANQRTVNSISLAQSIAESRDDNGWAMSMYSLPLQSQHTFEIIVMIPVGVMLILLLRNIIGIETLGTFTPVLIGLAFRETQVLWGIFLFTFISALGLGLRSYLEHLHLQLLSRLSVVLTFVVIVMALIAVLGHKLGLDRGLSIALFPMVILTMSIERLSIVWEERGGMHSIKVGIGTLFAATLAHLMMSYPPWVYFVFTFPGTLLVFMALMLALGHYRGYRLMELFRFKDMVREPD
ncbi:inactive transglutaminase family protein [Spongiibacter nanhainus]|uniref:Inactive transglutaminase family protein n=1 Tax=Spongiibacter nanhainus TaxID=2794344 RepID=A0A7T4R1F3_9GAMM|nr:inactive transglutaminase family protein [Spongiibacter nanhainus]QQD18499.1 inactive transglutaminase family protein [Spongiibacter nanhainus]